MALYDDLKKKQEELQKQQIEVEKQLKEIKEKRKEKAIRQNSDYIMSIPEEDKKVLLKYVHHPSWCHKKNKKFILTMMILIIQKIICKNLNIMIM